MVFEPNSKFHSPQKDVFTRVLKPLPIFQERRISREEVKSIVAGGKTLEVEVVERYL